MMMKNDINNDDEILIWLDKNINEEDNDCRLTLNILRQISDHVLLQTDSILCINNIRSIINEKIFLIVSDL